jgi:integrase
MPTITLVARGIAGLQVPTQGRVEYFDKTTPGFGLRVTSAGHRSWICLYRNKGQKRRFTIGTYPQLGLADARERAKEVLWRAAKGRDPATEKKRGRQAETFRDLAEQYLGEYAKANKRSWKADHNILYKDLIPRFGSRKAAEISRREIRDLLKAIGERGAPIQSNRTLEIVRKVFNWAISEELVENNPCDHIAKPSPENQRTRVLTSNEIRHLWAALDTRPPIFAAAYRLMLATAQRSIEVLGATYDEVGADGWWTIPPGRVKNKTEHRVWLSKIARQAIATIEPYRDSSPYLFPSRDGRHLRRLHKTHARLCRVAEISDFKVHDLRRTAASYISAAGISRLIVAKVLNHKEREITAVYDRYGYGPEIRRALDIWGARIEEILLGTEGAGNVTPSS